MYIHVSWSWRHLGILGHLFQVGIAVLAFYIGNHQRDLFSFLSPFSSLGYSRISDFHHNWFDVLVGAIVGSLIAFVAFKFILDWRHYSTKFLPYTVSAQRTGSYSPPMNGYSPRRISNNEIQPIRSYY